MIYSSWVVIKLAIMKREGRFNHQIDNNAL